MFEAMYEVYKCEGRSRVLVARFRIRRDAERYIAAFGDDEALAGAELELVVPSVSPRSSTLPPASSKRTRPRPKSGPQSSPGTERTRHTSGVVVASEHPDEFIADRANNDD